MTYEDEEQLAWRAMEARDFATAVRLLKLLAERDSAYALMSLGWIYETGAIGEPNLAAAKSFYKHAAKLGSPEAHSYLGSLLLNRGDLEQAEEAFRCGASLGDETSQSMLLTVTDHRAEQ